MKDEGGTPSERGEPHGELHLARAAEVVAVGREQRLAGAVDGRCGRAKDADRFRAVLPGEWNADEGIVARAVGLLLAVEVSRRIAQLDGGAGDGLRLLVLHPPTN